MPREVVTVDSRYLADGKTGDSALVVKYARGNIAASQTDSSLVSAVSNRAIKVVMFRLSSTGAGTTVVFNTKPAGAGTAISEVFQGGAAGTWIQSPYAPPGHFATNVGEGLTVTTGAGSTQGIGIVYVEMPA